MGGRGFNESRVIFAYITLPNTLIGILINSIAEKGTGYL